MQLGRVMLACAAAALLAACAGDTTVSGGVSASRPPLKVAIVQGRYYTDGLFAALAADPELVVTTITRCSESTLSRHDVVWIYGNGCFEDGDDLSEYVEDGGGLVVTPWVFTVGPTSTCCPSACRGGPMSCSRPRST